jgi:hypothetical protein
MNVIKKIACSFITLGCFVSTAYMMQQEYFLHKETPQILEIAGTLTITPENIEALLFSSPLKAIVIKTGATLQLCALELELLGKRSIIFEDETSQLVVRDVTLFFNGILPKIPHITILPQSELILGMLPRNLTIIPLIQSDTFIKTALFTSITIRNNTDTPEIINFCTTNNEVLVMGGDKAIDGGLCVQAQTDGKSSCVAIERVSTKKKLN